MIKRTPNGLYVSDELTIDLTRVKSELKQKFVREVRDYNEGGRQGVAPKLVASVAATHAGLPTGNMAFYIPDRMKAGLPSFTDGYPKPVLLHHNDMRDPVGRVHRATYRDLSHKYLEPMKRFTERYGGTTFCDSQQDLEKAFDQVEWVMENMVPMKDYAGLGYGELDLHITDAEAAEKIMDQRYLTVSVGFTTDSMYCSNCHQDWASEGFCEHERGKVYDGKRTLVIPGKFIYEEVSWVNNPADSNAKVLSVSETPSLAGQTLELPQSVENAQDSMCVPILISVSDGKVSRLDSFKKVTPERAQEVIDVAKQEDNTQPKAPELVEVEIDGNTYQFSADAKGLLETEDAKREHYITAPVEGGHQHRVMIDPETGNGHTDYVEDHSHEVVGRVIKEAGTHDYNDETGQVTMKNVHTHELDKKVAPLTDEQESTEEKVEDAAASEDNAEVEVEDASKKSKKRYRKMSDEIEGEDEIELEDGADVPEGYELIEEDAQEQDAQEEDSDPTQFELTDWASVEAARAAVNDSELSDAIKARTIMAINKKAKELELSAPSELDPVEVELVDPTNEDASIKLGFTSEEDFVASVKEMTPEAREANEDALTAACGVFGITLESIKDSLDAGAGRAVRLTKAEAQAAAKALFYNIDKALIDEMVNALNENVIDDKRAELGTYIVDRLIEEQIVDNFFADYVALQKELEDARKKLAAVTKANRDFYASKQDDLARVVVALKVALKKPEFVDLNDEALETKMKELKVRSVDSLQDSLSDLINEFSGSEQIDSEETNEVVEEPVDSPEVGRVVQKDTVDRQDLDIFQGLTDAQYRVALSIQNRYKNRS